MIYDKNITEITLEDIESLIDNKMEENKYLEYKGCLKKGEADKIRKEVCGFANADGGLFIYGLEEKDGVPTKIVGIPINSWDDKKRNIQDYISQSEPRIHISLEKIDLEDNPKNKLILIQTPKSWNSPHRVKKGNGKTKEFYFRRDGKTEPLEYYELKNMFNLSNSLKEDIEEFRNKRISKVYYDSEHSGYKILIHAFPLESFTEKIFNINDAKEELNNLKSIRGVYEPSFEGQYYKGPLYTCQVYRNGIFEKIIYGEKRDRNVSLHIFEKEYIVFINAIFKLYKKLGISSPILFFITYTNIKDCYQKDELGFKKYCEFETERDVLISPGIFFEQYNDEEIEEKVFNDFSPFWNHFGYTR